MYVVSAWLFNMCVRVQQSERVRERERERERALI